MERSGLGPGRVGVAVLALVWAGGVAGAQVRASAAAPPATVLILFSLSSTAPSGPEIEAGFRAEIEKDLEGRVDILVEYLDLPDASARSYTRRLADLLRERYADRKLDLIVAVRYEALHFVLENGPAPFASVPVVAADIDRATFEQIHPPGEVTASLLKIGEQRTVSVALDLHPDARRVVLVCGSAPGDRGNEALARRLVERRAPGMETLSLAGIPLDEQLTRLGQLPSHSVVIFVSYRADALGQSTVAADVVRRVAQASSAPVYGAARPWLGRGIVGGDLIDYAGIGAGAARLASRILRGEPPASIPPTEEPGTTLMFDWRQLRRWSIDEARLPAGSVVLFREPTLWTEHRDAILGGLALLLGQAALIAALLVERRSRMRAESGVRQAEHRYRTVADFAHDWEYWRRPDGSFDFMSPSCRRVTGHAAEEFYRRPALLDELVVEQDRQRWRTHDEQARVGGGTARLELRIRDATGRILWIDHICSPVTGEDGSFLGVRGSNRDVTERKRSEDDLRRALAEIERLRERLEADNSYLREQVEPGPGFEGIIGKSDVLRYVISKVQQVAPTSSTVLLQGETGVGKELAAHAIHSLSPRRGRPLVKLNCAALPPSLVESELFGHEKGAFTGAVARRKGRFEIADGSTLFLDEIGELPLELQAKLLRVIQDGELERVGGTETLRTDVRLIAATNRRLDEEVAAGRFREDLWYRLNVFPITMPPLRQRPEDIPLLVRHLVEKHCRKLGRPALEISHGIVMDLQAHDWPGNVRELDAVLERAVITSTGGVLRLGDELRARGTADPSAADASVADVRAAGAKTLVDLEREHIVATLERSYWRLEGEGGAAAQLGINPSTLRSRMRKHGIQRPGSRPPETASPRTE